jgi:hypothetical protein
VLGRQRKKDVTPDASGLAARLAKKSERVISAPMLYVTSNVRVQEFQYYPKGRPDISGLVYIQVIGRVLTDERSARDASRIGAIQQVLWTDYHHSMASRLYWWEPTREPIMRKILDDIQRVSTVLLTDLSALHEQQEAINEASQKIVLYTEMFLRNYRAIGKLKEVRVTDMEEHLGNFAMLLSALYLRYRRSYQFYQLAEQIAMNMSDNSRERQAILNGINSLKRLDAREQRYVVTAESGDLQQRVEELAEGRMYLWRERVNIAAATMEAWL